MSEFVDVKTSELSGTALDYATGMAVGAFDEGEFKFRAFQPSTDWSHGGPLIAKRAVAFACFPEDELKGVWAYSCSGKGEEYGPTHLIASCRAIVASVLGDTVSVPKELLS